MSLYTILEKIKSAVKNSSASKWSIGNIVEGNFAIIISDHDDGSTEIASYNLDGCETNSAEAIQFHNNANELIAVIDASINVLDDWIHAGRPALSGDIGLKQMRALEATLEKLK